MKLKIRYASLLIAILLVICLFTYIIAKSVITEHYLRALTLAALLYGCSFFMGKKFRKVFFLLSTIKFIKESGGITSIAAIEHHISRGGTSTGELPEEIITLLLEEKIVEQQDKNILLTGE